jgi:hypothetical protein
MIAGRLTPVVSIVVLAGVASITIRPSRRVVKSAEPRRRNHQSEAADGVTGTGAAPRDQRSRLRRAADSNEGGHLFQFDHGGKWTAAMGAAIVGGVSEGR